MILLASRKSVRTEVESVLFKSYEERGREALQSRTYLALAQDDSPGLPVSRRSAPQNYLGNYRPIKVHAKRRIWPPVILLS